ncbi:MAG: hypothetical protein ACXWLM_12060, partial [Myxococcales bacterium]
HLRAGHLPLWDTMVESGVSILGQVTPGLLHPATLLYLVLPFDVAFKLNHALGPLLGGIGAFLLARRLGASAWASLAGGIAYGGCGYVISMAGSNLPFALGAGSVPIAVDAVLGFVERRTVGRFAWAGAAVASIGYAGEPQAAAIAGLLSAAWAMLLAEKPAQIARNLGLAAACGALAVCLAAPAVLPGWFELRRSSRAAGLTERDLASFANHPVRLAGLLVPRAFDDAPEASGGDFETSLETYPELFGSPSAAFADSIVLGVPALLFALAAAWAGRRGRLLLAGGLVFALASTGRALGIDRVLFAALPLASIFRFAEKLIAPASSTPPASPQWSRPRRPGAPCADGPRSASPPPAAPGRSSPPAAACSTSRRSSSCAAPSTSPQSSVPPPAPAPAAGGCSPTRRHRRSSARPTSASGRWSRSPTR